VDRQAIERRDFPIGRRGYDPAAVDAHLRALAAAFEDLQRTAAGRGDTSLAAAAGTQVQSIIEAAETAAADIQRSAQESARETRESADRDAERTREEALKKARAHVAAVAQVTATLLERVGSMDAEVNALIVSLRAGAGRLAADLSAVDAGMGDLYGAASGGASDTGGRAERATTPAAAPSAPAASPPETFEAALDSALSAPSQPAAPAESASAQAVEGAADLDGARLSALNMALNNHSRAETEQYLAENFELPDRGKLVDEVYAAIEA
jgi:DivIVA domain-containing protein